MHNFSEEFPILDHCIFMNHAGVSPISARAANAIRRWTEEAQTGVGEHWSSWAKALARNRKNAAALMHCDASEVALVHSTTHGLILAANSLPWRPGDNLILAEHEFPANIYPWKNLAAHGVAARMVPEREGRFRVEDFTALMDSRTRLVAVSMVQYATGFRMPVEALGEICRSRGILFCVDGIQALGALPVDVAKIGCHFFSSNGHKWMLSPEGFGVLYIDKNVMDQMNACMTGWVGRARPWEYGNTDQPLAPSAKRFEMGSHALVLAAALEQSMGLLLEAGESAIWQAIEGLTDRLAEGLLKSGFEVVSSRRKDEKSGILAFTGKGVDADKWALALRERKIFVAPRRGYLRVSPHFYNRSEQIDALLDALAELRRAL